MSPNVNNDSIKILLLQIRNDAETSQEEFFEFVQYSGLQEHNFTVLNSFEQPTFSADVLKGYDALFVGGSSDASVLAPEQYPFVNNCKQLMQYAYDHAIPTLASCFGFQLAVEQFGGTVIDDKNNMEIGIYPITLTAAAKSDPFLYDCPDSFPAICGHKERAASLPSTAIAMGSSPLCPYHVFKMADKPIYAFQFHPEIDLKDLTARLLRYQDRYLDDAQAAQRILEKCTQETPDANALIRKFVERIIPRK